MAPTRGVNEPERTGTAFRLEFVQGGERKAVAFRLQNFSIYTPGTNSKLTNSGSCIEADVSKSGREIY
jgi:hypothetical protein